MNVMTGLMLTVYLLIAATSAYLVGEKIRARRFTRPYHGDIPRDPLETAFLAGGPGRVADTVIAAMHADGRIAVDASGQLTVLRPVASNPVETALLEACGAEWGGGLRQVRTAVLTGSPVQSIGDRLARRGLFFQPEVHRRWRRVSTLHKTVWCLLLFLSLAEVMPHLVVGSGLPLFVRVLPGLAVGLFVLLTCSAPRGRLTPAGKRVLHGLRLSNRPLLASRTASTGSDATMLFALAGAASIQDTVLRDQLAQSSQPSSDASDPGSWGDAAGGWAGGGTSCGGSASSCGGSSSSCGGGGGSASSCGGGSGSGCGSSSGSSCGSSSGSSCGSSSGSSCGSSSS
ncbi:TIGR04222 domain-containing membrane protein [Streptomyces sp. So13.3]|uniref:TIGR04222 domain-containing membrane protein n=2 Tax=Streptomyces TaxID=1883 RepID=UPI001105F512|nr:MULTISPECIES: TIGR04222 domain-containing membrane protein [Streptomyces]QNA75894.1 TIGR04222 domain-containing membrane protein [Streptomyces sp. So13.3]